MAENNSQKVAMDTKSDPDALAPKRAQLAKMVKPLLKELTEAAEQLLRRRRW